MADQQRNAHQVERNGIGLRLEKTDLESVGKLEVAIKEILGTEKSDLKHCRDSENGTYFRYREAALKMKSLIADRPFSMTEVGIYLVDNKIKFVQIFVKNMEFLAKHGPLRQLDHYGRHLNVFQYYLIDVIAFVVLTSVVLVTIFAVAIRWTLRRVLFTKLKND